MPQALGPVQPNGWLEHLPRLPCRPAPHKGQNSTAEGCLPALDVGRAPFRREA